MNPFKIFALASLFFFPEKMPRQNSCTQERAEENDPPKCEAFLKYFEPRRPKFYGESILPKENKALGIFLKKHFLKVFILVLEK